MLRYAIRRWDDRRPTAIAEKYHALCEEPSRLARYKRQYCWEMIDGDMVSKVPVHSLGRFVNAYLISYIIAAVLPP